MLFVGRDSSAGKATRYGLGGSMIESRWERFSAPVQTGPAPHPAYYLTGTGTSSGVKRPGRGVDHPPHLAPRLKKEKSYISTPSVYHNGKLNVESYNFTFSSK